MVISLVLLFTNSRWNYFNRVRSVISVVVSPVQYLVDGPIRFVDWIGDYFTLQHRLIADNTAMHTQNLLLQAKVQKILALEKENQQLRRLLSSSSKINSKVLVAQILSVNANRFDPQVILDKGSNSNVKVGQPVLDAYGVMGQVIETDPTSSRVLLITSTRSAVPVEDSRSGIRAVAAGDGYSGDLNLLYVTDTADVKAGDVLITSGLGLKFPQGYPVGVVTKVEHVAGQQFATITVDPSAHLERSRQVLLVQR